MSTTREFTVRGSWEDKHDEQYSLAKILGIWALATAPMGVLGWIVFPLLAPDAGCCLRWVWSGCSSCL
jgi:hypothetical protein